LCLAGLPIAKRLRWKNCLGSSVTRKDVVPRIAQHLGKVFDLELKEASRAELWEKLQEAELPVAASA